MPRVYGADGSDGILICTECRTQVFLANDRHLPPNEVEDWGDYQLERYWACLSGKAYCPDCHRLTYDYGDLPIAHLIECQCGWSAS